MTIYNVHLYREMRLTFEGIEADSPESAAAIASNRPESEAAAINACDGEHLAALVDTAGDESFRHSVTIEFEGERQRKAAPKLLAALEGLLPIFCEMIDDLEDSDESGSHPLVVNARNAIVDAKAAGTTPAQAGASVQALLAGQGQIASIWSIEDVQAERPDLNDDQAWAVLQQAEGNHDATIGINWEVLRFHAQNLFGDAPETDAGEGA